MDRYLDRVRLPGNAEERRTRISEISGFPIGSGPMTLIDQNLVDFVNAVQRPGFKGVPLDCLPKTIPMTIEERLKNDVRRLDAIERAFKDMAASDPENPSIFMKHLSPANAPLLLGKIEGFDFLPRLAQEVKEKGWKECDGRKPYRSLDNYLRILSVCIETYGAGAADTKELLSPKNLRFFSDGFITLPKDIEQTRREYDERFYIARFAEYASPTKENRQKIDWFARGIGREARARVRYQGVGVGETLGESIGDAKREIWAWTLDVAHSLWQANPENVNDFLFAMSAENNRVFSGDLFTSVACAYVNPVTVSTYAVIQYEPNAFREYCRAVANAKPGTKELQELTDVEEGMHAWFDKHAEKKDHPLGPTREELNAKRV